MNFSVLTVHFLVLIIIQLGLSDGNKYCTDITGYAEMTLKHTGKKNPCRNHENCSSNEFCGVDDIYQIDKFTTGICTKKYQDGDRCVSHYSCTSNYCYLNKCRGREYKLKTPNICQHHTDCRIDQYCYKNKCHTRYPHGYSCWHNYECISNSCSWLRCKYADEITEYQLRTANNTFNIQIQWH